MLKYHYDKLKDFLGVSRQRLDIHKIHFKFFQTIHRPTFYFAKLSKFVGLPPWKSTIPEIKAYLHNNIVKNMDFRTMLLYISSPAGIKFSDVFFSEIANYILREENEAREVEEQGAREREAERIWFTKVSDDEYAQFFARHQAREAAKKNKQ